MMDSMRDPRSKNFGHFNCIDVSCHECPLDSIGCNESQNAIDLIEVVDKWGKEHPFVTNADKFKEVFGREPRVAPGGDYWCSSICLGDCPRTNECGICTKNFWESEYKEPKKSEVE